MVYKTEERQEIHDKWVQRIAKIRFNFPNDDHPNWETYTNHPDKTWAIENEEGEEIYPDIVVVDSEDEKPVMIGEVETEDSVTEEEAEQWREYSEAVQPLFLYVPEGYCADAKERAEEAEAEIEGFRFYYWDEDLNPRVKDCQVEEA